MYKKHIKNYSLVLIGTVAYCLGINLFIVPANLYNGGVMGIAQLLRTFFIQSLKLNIPASADLSGIIFFILNIPIMIIAYKDISRSFFVKTIVAVVVQTILLSAIPIPSEAIVSDITAASVTGAILCGFGTGITLLAGGSCGGTDTLGIFFAKRYRTLTVGKLSLYINVFIYLICSILFDFEIAIFSVFVSIVGNTVVDRLHAQNIMVTAMIFTHNHNLKNQIMSSLNRGTTYWNGYGGYTDKETDILVTAVSKYEIHTLRKIVRENDSKAFIIINQNISVLGNFEKRLS